MAKPLIIVGRAGIDLYARDHNTDLSAVTSFDRYVGGAGANIAVQAARLSGESILLTRVADDHWGKYIRSYLKKTGVIVPTSPAPLASRNSLAITEIKKKNSKVLFYRQDPSDHHLSPEDIDEKIISQASGLILTGTSLSGTPSREAVDLLLFYALRYNKPLILDLDYRPGFRNKWEVFLNYKKVMEKSNILVGTEEEFKQVVNVYPKSIPNFTMSQLRYLKKEKDIATFFLQGMTRIVIIKRGEKGSAAYLRGKKNIQMVPGGVFPVTVVKNFGAGDAFVGTFCHYYLKSQNLSLALKRATASAAIVVSKGSCTEAMPTEKELFNFIKKKKIPTVKSIKEESWKKISAKPKTISPPMTIIIKRLLKKIIPFCPYVISIELS